MNRLIAFTLALFAALIPAAAQPPHRSLTMDDGLPSNTVRNIVQDRFGFVWFGTDNGLCRYDGTGLQPYPLPELERNQYVSALLAGRDGLYIGTEGGVFRFCFDSQTCERLPMDIRSTVSHLAIDKDSTLWVSTMQEGVWRYDTRTGQHRAYSLQASGQGVGQVLVDADNRVWTVTNWGLPAVQRLNKVYDRFEPVPVSDADEVRSLCMLQTADGSLWLGTWEEGLLRLHDDGRTECLLSPVQSKVGRHIHALYELSPDCLCIGCDDGLITVNPHTGQWQRLLTPDRFAYAIMRDHEGGLWVGTFYGGVKYLSAVDKRFDAYSAAIGTPGLHGGVISRFCEDAQGHIWIASDDGGVACFDPSASAFVAYPHEDVLSRQNAHALMIDGSDLWIGTYAGGVYVLDTRSGRLRSYGPQGDARGLADVSSYDIFRDSRDTIWVATMNGLYRYDRSADRFSLAKQIAAMTIDIAEDRQGDLWLGTQGSGLWLRRRADGQWRQFVSDPGDAASLPDDQVNCLCLDDGGQLWVGTYQGLCRWDGAGGFVRVHLDIPSQNVLSIIEGQDALWLSTDRGIVRYVPGEGVQRFTRQDGLVSEQFQPNAGLRASSGRIYFGTANGFNAFLPQLIKTNNMEPPVYVTSIEILNRKEMTADGLPLDLSQTREIVLGYGDGKMVAIAFASLSYCSPDKNQYAYRLEGFDKDWNYVANQHRAVYTNMPPGTYTFRVRATNNDGVWSEHQAELRLVVRPPLWWTWWAKLLYVVATVIAIWWYVHSRLKRAERRHRSELRRLKEQQERDVRDARLNFFTMIAHEIRTPVSLIIGPLEKLKGTATDPTAPSAGYIEVIDRNAHRLLELVGQLLDFRKVEQQSLVMKMQPQNVAQLVRAVSDRFAPTFAQGGKRFTVQLPDEHFTAIVDREAITKVISNLLTNANKYTRDLVELTCSVEPDGEHFRISVSDNGVGISEQDRERIFEPFFQAQTSKPGTGIGLNIVKNIVEQHHGSISVVSEVGRGSAFTVVLPIAPAGWDGVADAVAEQQSEPTVENTARETTTTTAPEGDAPGGTLLIVDDNEDMVAFLADGFRANYRVLTAHDGIEALHQLGRHADDVQLIISDWMMPRMDGAELCRRVRSNPATSHIAFVMLTAKTDADSRLEAVDVGADIYVEKPFSVQYLEGCIRNMLDMRRRLRERYSAEPLAPVAQIAANPVDNEFLVRMNQLIEDNFANPDLNVAFLAEQMAISRSGLFAKIKTLADMTPNEMIQLVRLKRAAQLLAEGRYQVSEVCYKVGFSSPSYFAKCFQKQFGIRPSEVAAQHEK